MKAGYREEMGKTCPPQRFDVVLRHEAAITRCESRREPASPLARRIAHMKRERPPHRVDDAPYPISETALGPKRPAPAAPLHVPNSVQTFKEGLTVEGIIARHIGLRRWAKDGPASNEPAGCHVQRQRMRQPDPAW